MADYNPHEKMLYALKDTVRSTLAVDDIVIVTIDTETGQREIGDRAGFQFSGRQVEYEKSIFIRKGFLPTGAVEDNSLFDRLSF